MKGKLLTACAATALLFAAQGAQAEGFYASFKGGMNLTHDASNTLSPDLSGIELVTSPGDFTCQLDFSTPGRVNALVTSTLTAFAQWQILHFGSMDNPLAQEDEDPDGDGQGNRFEFLAGTHPNNSLSVFAAGITPAPGGAFLLTWPSVPGKSYAILGSTNPSSGWLPLHSLKAGPGDTTTHLVPGPHQGTRFFRIQVE